MKAQLEKLKMPLVFFFFAFISFHYRSAVDDEEEEMRPNYLPAYREIDSDRPNDE